MSSISSIISGAGGITVCTSSTRPPSPTEGQVIYETDTDLLLVYDGSSWTSVAPASPTWTSYTPTLTLTGLTPTYAQQTGEYIVQDDWCTARFTIRINTYSGSHSAPYDWVVNLPVTPEISSGFTQNVGTMLNNLHVYPAGYGVASCAATAASQNILFYLDSTSTVKLRNATHNGNKWSPSPDPIMDPEVMVAGTLQYKV